MKNAVSNFLWRALLSSIVSQSTGLLVTVILLHALAIVPYKTGFGLYLSSCGSGCQKPNLMAKPWEAFTGIPTFREPGSFDWAYNIEKEPKWCHFEMVWLLGLERFRHRQTNFVVDRVASRRLSPHNFKLIRAYIPVKMFEKLDIFTGLITLLFAFRPVRIYL